MGLQARPAWGWFTGWFNLIGLVAVTASVDYGCATFMNVTFGVFDFNLFNGVSGDFFSGTFWLFVIILAFHALVNIAGSHLVARINGVSVGFSSGMYWFYVVPLGFLLTQYTITGFDSCAHISEETHGAADNAAKGVWRSIFYSAIFGWIVLLGITFCATNVDAVNKDAVGGAYVAVSILSHALDTGWLKVVLVISTVGQLFCGAACLTSASRMCYAFSRDGAMPGWKIWSRVNATRVPANAVLFMAACGAIITVPAYWPAGNGVPVAFFAVVSIAVIGLYIAYVIPIYLRWRMGDSFQTGPWTLARKYKWMNPFATVWVALITLIFILPTSPGGVPWRDEFEWRLVNYAPLVTGAVIVAVAIWWLVSARHTFTGPRHTIAELDAELGEPHDGGDSAVAQA